MSKSRDIGTSFENRVVAFMKSAWPKVKRIGSRDFGGGDIEGVPNFVVECKASSTWGQSKLENWMSQTESSRERKKKRWKVLFIRRKFFPMSKSYVVLEAGDWEELCREFSIK